MKKVFKKAYPFLFSLWLHAALFLALFVGDGTQTGNNTVQGGSGSGSGYDDSRIVPKLIEVELVEPPKSEGELQAQAKPKAPSEGIKECEGDNWFGGIGVQMLGFSHNAEEIGEVFPGYPAHKAGLKSGDMVLSVDGRPYNFGEIRGEPGTVVVITIFRPSTNETKTYTIVREKICTKRS